jgi:hypothetical protein
VAQKLTDMANVDGEFWVGGNGSERGHDRRIPLRMRPAERQSRVQTGDYPSKKGPADERDGEKVISSKMGKYQLQNIEVDIVSRDHGNARKAEQDTRRGASWFGR